MQDKILLYEDSAAGAVLVRTAIEECGLGCEVTTASSHAEVENLLATGQFDLLQTNFGTDEEEATRFIRSVRANGSIAKIRRTTEWPNESD
jgi:hypothetical protein